jgi:SAM-dependent methyltransferase
MSTGTDIGSLAPALERRPPGIWFARRQAAVSYPSGGHAACLQVEDSSFWFRHRNRCIMKAVERFHPSGSLLDVGGGNGYVARGLQKAGVDCVLVEPGVEGALAAHARGVDNVICARLEDAGLPPASFAAVGLFDVLEHLEDERAALGVIRDVLMPGGRLFVTVPAFQALFSAEDVAAGHYRRYSATRLERSLRQAGFELDYLTYIFWPLPLPVFLFRVLPSWFGRRPSEEPELTASEHAPRGLAARLMDRALQWECDVLARGGRMLIGGSCLAVARRVDLDRPIR